VNRGRRVVIEIFRDRLRQWRFRMVAGNGQIIAQSEGYTRRAGALKGISVLRRAHLCAVVYQNPEDEPKARFKPAPYQIESRDPE